MCDDINLNHQNLILQYIPSPQLISLRLVCRSWNFLIQNMLTKRRMEFLKKIKNLSTLKADCISEEYINSEIVDEQKLCIMGDTLYRFGGCHHHRYSNRFEQFSLFGDRAWSCVDVQGHIRPPPTSKAHLVPFCMDGLDPILVLTSDVIRPISQYLLEIMYSLNGLVFFYRIKERIWTRFEFPELRNLNSYTTFFVGHKIVFHGILTELDGSVKTYLYTFDVKLSHFAELRTTDSPCYSTAHYVVNESKVVVFPIFYENMRSFEYPFIGVMTFDWKEGVVVTQRIPLPVFSNLIFYPIQNQQISEHILGLVVGIPRSEHIIDANYGGEFRDINGLKSPVFTNGVLMQVMSIDPSISNEFDLSKITVEYVLFNLSLQCLSVSFVVHFDCIYAVCRVKRNNLYYRNVYHIY